ncbi:hypothetical protein EMMF5_004615 [Cystobasidiomycetes sp. EMM_F5]
MLTTSLCLLGLIATATASELYAPAHAHGRRNSLARRKCKAKSSSSGSSTSSAASSDSTGKTVKAAFVANNSSSTTTTSSGNSTVASSSNYSGTWLKRNCVYWGWLPGDYQYTTTGLKMEPKEVNTMVGTPAKYVGMYAHMVGNKYKKGDTSTYFTGSEILHWTDYLQGTNSIPILSIMPTFGFQGMTASDNTQALQVAKVVKHFADAGFEVYLRFGHEMNWYFSPNSDDARDGSAFYLGTAADYIASWKIVTAAVKAAVPTAKMFWCPNSAWDAASAYANYWPGKDYVDVVGVDFYPTSDYSSLASHVQDIHDTYAKANGLPFHIGETGSTKDFSTKLKWATVVSSQSTCNSLPNLVAVHWFEYDMQRDGGDFRLTADPSNAKQFTAMMKTS